MLTSLIVLVSACNNSRISELKKEIKAVQIERDFKTAEFALNSDEIFSELSLIQRLKAIDPNSDVSESEKIISELENENVNLKKELDQLSEKSKQILNEYEKLSK